MPLLQGPSRRLGARVALATLAILAPLALALGQGTGPGKGQTAGKKLMWGTESEAVYQGNRHPGSEGMSKALKEISDSFGIPLSRLFELHAVGSADDKGALVFFNRQNNSRIIYYGRGLDSGFGGPAKNWPAIVVLAHEMGHHLMKHSQEESERETQEVQADWFAGCVVAMLKGKLADATTAYEHASSRPLGTHPGRARRIEMVTAGWQVGNSSTSRDRCIANVPRS